MVQAKSEHYFRQLDQAFERTESRRRATGNRNPYVMALEEEIRTHWRLMRQYRRAAAAANDADARLCNGVADAAAEALVTLFRVRRGARFYARLFEVTA